jgi:hypothetical protein
MTKKSLDYVFPVSQELRHTPAKIYQIGIEGDSLIIQFQDKKGEMQQIKSYISGDKMEDIDTVRKRIESELSWFFDLAATAYCTGRLVDVIDRLYDTDMAHAIEKIKKKQRAQMAELDKQGSTGQAQEKPVFIIKKFSGATTVSPNGQGLAEAVIINGKPMFAMTINCGNGLTFYDELETETMILRPPSLQEYPPNSAYEFASEDELIDYLKNAKEHETLYTLYDSVRKFYTKDYFVDTDPKNSILLAVYTLTSYFQDKFSTVPYIWLIGDNGSGKNSVLLVYSALGYRVFYMSGASGANICEYLGTVEEGQGTIAEDELGNLDKDDYKKLLFMTGYASGSCVPKILDGNTKGRQSRYYRSYCQKISASENLPSIRYSKGVLDREFIVKCVKGFPKYNAKLIKKRTGSPEVLSLINELQTIRERLFAFRLAHFGDVIDEIQGINISGRALELTESALSLFYKYKATDYDKETFKNEILSTLSSFLKERLNRRNDSLEARIYPIIQAMIDASDGKDEFDNDTIFNTVCTEMEGRELPGKSGIFYVADLGITITRTQILRVLKEKFKAIPFRIPKLDGTRQNGLKFLPEVLERIAKSYEDTTEISISSLFSEDTSAPQSQVSQVTEEYGDKNDENDSGVESKNEPLRAG